MARTNLEGGLGLGEEEFERFYAGTSAALWAYLRRLGGDPALADDILQESYVKLLGRVDPASEEREKRAYLYRIATNLLRDRWRQERREVLGLSSLLGRWEERGRAADAPLKVDLESAFQRLEPRERAILWLAYVEGYDHREIAGIVGVKEGSVRVLLFRARKKAARELDRKEVSHERYAPTGR
ncbi:MAG TPA: RNA polymerase sigma factor [Thermoanaerobaculia bacterium]